MLCDKLGMCGSHLLDDKTEALERLSILVTAMVAVAKLGQNPEVPWLCINILLSLHSSSFAL